MTDNENENNETDNNIVILDTGLCYVLFCFGSNLCAAGHYNLFSHAIRLV